MKQRKPIDTICQHSKDGEIIPLKIRLTDEDGECQEYMGCMSRHKRPFMNVAS